jgi:hypothetical protein
MPDDLKVPVEVLRDVEFFPPRTTARGLPMTIPFILKIPTSSQRKPCSLLFSRRAAAFSGPASAATRGVCGAVATAVLMAAGLHAAMIPGPVLAAVLGADPQGDQGFEIAARAAAGQDGQESCDHKELPLRLHLLPRFLPIQVLTRPGQYVPKNQQDHRDAPCDDCLFLHRSASPS